jgi:hypothetical protein
MERRTIASNEQSPHQKLMTLIQFFVGLILTLLCIVLLLSWGYEVGLYIGTYPLIFAFLAAAVGTPLVILLYKKVLFPYFTKLRK